MLLNWMKTRRRRWQQPTMLNWNLSSLCHLHRCFECLTSVFWCHFSSPLFFCLLPLFFSQQFNDHWARFDGSLVIKNHVRWVRECKTLCWVVMWSDKSWMLKNIFQTNSILTYEMRINFLLNHCLIAWLTNSTLTNLYFVVGLSFGIEKKN